MGVFAEKSEPDEVFAVLSDDTRVDILQALWEADGHEATFSELREAVGMRDSGKFNYHLDKLVGIFVSKNDEGYELTEAGKHIYGTIQTGAYTIEASIEPITLEEPCPTCGGTYTFTYEDESVLVECDSCGMQHGYGMPPGAIANYEREDIPDVASRFGRTMISHISNGFCWFCKGKLDIWVAPVTDVMEPPDTNHELHQNDDDLPIVAYECQRCGTNPHVALDVALLGHPAVESFFYERGIDVTDRQLWYVTSMRPDRVFIRQRDPLRASVTYRHEDDSITLVVDEDLTVISVEQD